MRVRIWQSDAEVVLFQMAYFPDSTPLLSVQLTAASRTQISAIDSVAFVTPLGQVLHTFPRKNKGFVNEFLISTEEFRIPKEEFSIRLEGKDTGIF